jgi:hypothetical protein
MKRRVVVKRDDAETGDDAQQLDRLVARTFHAWSWRRQRFGHRHLPPYQRSDMHDRPASIRATWVVSSNTGS